MGQTFTHASLFLYISSIYTLTSTVCHVQAHTHTTTTILIFDTLSSSSSVNSLSSLSKRSICRSFFLSFRTTVCAHCTSITSSEQLAIVRLAHVAPLSRTVRKGLWVGLKVLRRLTSKCTEWVWLRACRARGDCAQLWGRGSRLHHNIQSYENSMDDGELSRPIANRLRFFTKTLISMEL